MSDGTDLLVVELLTEELPPKALKMLGEAFAGLLAQALRQRDFLLDTSEVTAFATPRRLAVAISAVRGVAPDAPILRKLVPRKIALDAQGQPSQALVGKLTSLGRANLATPSLDASEGPDELVVQSDGKAEYVYLRSIATGKPLVRGLEEALAQAVEKLPIPKVMRYASPAGGYYTDLAFVRPAHRLLALHGPDVVPVSVLGLHAGRTTDGHRFLSRTGISVAHARAWAPTVEAEGKVIPSFAVRREAIVAALHEAAQGAQVVAPAPLLDEVTALVEWPVVYAGTFDAAFLSVPQECLILTMQQNQKYFALTDPEGRMQARFLVVSNLATGDPAAIIGGNERVLRARLADAQFFYDQDRRVTLESRLERLASVVYHQKLGTQAERVDRLRFLATAIAREIGADESLANRAAMLAKADLVTDMVGEFPELQGTMGRYYALHDGERPVVAEAIAQHYWPRFAGDALPQGREAQAVALADKLESLAGMFGIGQPPTGDKDPFGLRRAAIGVVRILVERQIDVPLHRLVSLAFDALEGAGGIVREDTSLEAFILDRLRGYLRELGGSVNQVEALLAVDVSSLAPLPARLAAVRAFESLPEAAALAAGNKRIVNILRKSGTQGSASIDEDLFVDGAERGLWSAFRELEPLIDSRLATGDYASALEALARSRPVVDRFFDEVMVMADDPSVRANRLALLRSVAATMNRVADISKLAQ